MSTTEQNKANDRRAFEAVNQKDVVVFDEWCAPGIVVHDQSQRQGLDAFKQAFEEGLTSFPDLHYTILDQIAEGEKSVVRYQVMGTHQAELRGIPATGKQFTVTGIMIIYRDASTGKVTDIWIQDDDLLQMQQLGVIPSMG